MARLLYQGKPLEGNVAQDMISLVSRELTRAILQGYGGDLPQIKYDSPNWYMMASLRMDVYHFSAAKNYQQLKDMSAQLLGEDGKLRPFNEFRDIVNKISYQYNNMWLKTEYDTAVASGQMASSWADQQARSDDMPFLQYMTVMDDRVREEHAALHGIIRRVDDEFWDEYYPPNGWNCRCDVIQLPGDDYQESDLQDYNLPRLDDMFRTNMAKTGLVFPSGHQYYDGLPSDIEKAELKQLREDMLSWGKENLVGRKFTHPDIEGNLEFTNRSVKEILNQPHRDYVIKNLSLYNTDELLAKSIKVDQGVSGKDVFHYLKTNIAGKDSYVVVRSTGSENVIYSIVDNIKK